MEICQYDAEGVGTNNGLWKHNKNILPLSVTISPDIPGNFPEIRLGVHLRLVTELLPLFPNSNARVLLLMEILVQGDESN